MDKNSEMFVRRKDWRDLTLHKVGLNGLMSHEVVDFEPPDVAQSVARSWRYGVGLRLRGVNISIFNYKSRLVN